MVLTCHLPNVIFWREASLRGDITAADKVKNLLVVGELCESKSKLQIKLCIQDTLYRCAPRLAYRLRRTSKGIFNLAYKILSFVSSVIFLNLGLS